MPKNEIERLRDALEKSSFTVAVTGAGISIAAGGVTYSGMRRRSAFGARDMLSGDPDKMYQMFYRSFLSSMFGHGPTEAHRALAKLEELGKMQGIITTNVDCMHTMAGSENVAEIQGSFQVNVCTGCYTHRYWDYEKRDAAVIQINPKRIQFDRPADLNIHKGADPVFEKLMTSFS